MKLTTEQKIIAVIPLANLLIEFFDDLETECPKLFKHELKRSAKRFISEAEKQNEFILSFNTEYSKTEVSTAQHEIMQLLKQTIEKIEVEPIL